MKLSSDIIKAKIQNFPMTLCQSIVGHGDFSKFPGKAQQSRINLKIAVEIFRGMSYGMLNSKLKSSSAQKIATNVWVSLQFTNSNNLLMSKLRYILKKILRDMRVCFNNKNKATSGV